MSAQDAAVYQYGQPELIPLCLRRALPERSCYMVWYECQGSFFMQKNLESNMAQLWCPVEYNMPVFPNTAMVNTLPILKHQFTHYTLYTHPVHVKLAESYLAYCGKWWHEMNCQP